MEKKSDFSRRVLIYTTLMVLRKMRDQLGIEAMGSFLESYTRMIDAMSPQVKEQAIKELEKQGFERFYINNNC